jgi:transposase
LIRLQVDRLPVDRDPKSVWLWCSATAALLYQGRTGCQWGLLPHGFPPPGAVKYHFCTWRDDGTDQTIHDLLRRQVREKARRKADPSLMVLDTQSVHAAAGVLTQSTGRGAAKEYRAAYRRTTTFTRTPTPGADGDRCSRSVTTGCATEPLVSQSPSWLGGARFRTS